MVKYFRYAVKVEDGYIRRKNSSNFSIVGLDKADLYLSKHQAVMSAQRHGGKTVPIMLKELQEEEL